VLLLQVITFYLLNMTEADVNEIRLEDYRQEQAHKKEELEQKEAEKALDAEFVKRGAKNED
jgi:hypothetical protein